jgi:RNA polymerase sigma-70 factor (ECF subfamily)
VTALAERLIARLGPRGASFAERDAEVLDAALREAIAAGQAKLRHAPVAPEALIDRIADSLIATKQALDLAALRKLRAADLYFACALAAGDPRAVALAETELLPAARQAVARIDRSPAFVDEVVQRLRDRMFVRGAVPPAIEQYRGAGALAGWVSVTATRIALDLKRAEITIAVDPERELATLPAPDDPELAVIWRTCAAEYKAALAASFASLSRRERNLLRQRYLDELDIDALGRLYDVHPATAYRWIKQVEQRLATMTRAAVMQKLSLSESQARSMERLIVSQLQLSLARMLRGRG